MIIYSDVRTLTAARLMADLGRLPSVVVGSPPCQDASLANSQGKGVDGERTGLFFEALRLVRECRPVWCCFENVPGLRTRGIDRVLDELEAAGYTCWPLVVGARHVGAPHKRDRVWIVAADLSQIGCGEGPSWGPDTGVAGEREQALSEPPATDADQVDAVHGGLRTGEVSVQEQPKLCSSGGEVGAAADANTAQFYDNRPRQVAGAAGCVQGEAHQWKRVWPNAWKLADDQPNSTDADRPRLAQWEVDPGDDDAELPPALRAIGGAWRSWGQPLARHLRVADGVPSRVARACIAAYGDAVVPQIPEAIGRVMMRLAPTDGTVLDLFCGAAGGWSLGMHRAGYKTVAACEIDPWRREVFMNHNWDMV